MGVSALGSSLRSRTTSNSGSSTAAPDAGSGSERGRSSDATGTCTAGAPEPTSGAELLAAFAAAVAKTSATFFGGALLLLTALCLAGGSEVALAAGREDSRRGFGGGPLAFCDTGGWLTVRRAGSAAGAEDARSCATGLTTPFLPSSSGASFGAFLTTYLRFCFLSTAR